MTPVQAIRLRLRLDRGGMSAFGSERSFDPPIGRHWDADGEARGYYIDFGFKAGLPEWPPYWLEPIDRRFHVATAQWGLGAYERFVNGDGEQWLEAARRAADDLVEHQHRGGSQEGGWRQLFPMPHTYRLAPPWLSGITQGEGASLLVRVYRETRDERYADAAVRALKPMSIAVSDGGLLAHIQGAPVVEEYPSDPPSGVLNGAIFALWGYRDVGATLGVADATHTFEQLSQALASAVRRYDLGYWSRYDLYPHPVSNIASPAYHLLHIKQLQVQQQLVPSQELQAASVRFEAYRGSRRCRARALAQKIAFRLLVPRNPILAQRLPWNRRPRRTVPGNA